MSQKDPQTHAIIGAAMEVHRIMRRGFHERVYQHALAIELGLRSIPFEREREVPVFYKEQQLEIGYRPDFVCYSDIIVETKALSDIGGNEDAQVINYLRATGFQRGLLLNFGAASLQFKRLVLTQENA